MPLVHGRPRGRRRARQLYKGYWADLRVGMSVAESTANFLVNCRMNKQQQMRRSHRGGDLLLQVRSYRRRRAPHPWSCRGWCVGAHDRPRGEMAPKPKLLCDEWLATDGIRTSSCQHPVQHHCADGSPSLLGRETGRRLTPLPDQRSFRGPLTRRNSPPASHPRNESATHARLGRRGQVAILHPVRNEIISSNHPRRGLTAVGSPTPRVTHPR
jgi:hypothetical protein